MNNIKIYAVILAAGESSRMRSPKALLKITDQIFLEYVVSKIYKAGIENILIILGHEPESVLQSKEVESSKVLRNVKFIINENYERGQLSSIQTGIRELPEDAEAMLLFTVDRPLASADLINSLIKKFGETQAPVVVPIFGAQRGHPIIFSSSVFQEILRAPEDVGARAVVWAHHNEVVEVSTNEEEILINIDTPESYEKYILKNEKIKNQNVK